MKLLFVHQNMPGQYRGFIQWLADQNRILASKGHPVHKLVFLTQRHNNTDLPGVTTIAYKTHHVAAKSAYGLSKVWEDATGAGFGAVQAMETYEKETGWRPDVILGHTGWGELLFFKQLWPDVPILGFFEYFYRAKGGPTGFDPNDPPSAHSPYLLQARNVVPLSSIDAVDRGLTPTQWQRDTFPKSFHDKLYVCHDGIRTDLLKPKPDVSLKLGRVKKPVTRSDEIVTYVARNMEPMRGFQTVMRALPKILDTRPNARVVIVGSNDVSYSKKSKNPGGFRAEMEAEVGHAVDWDRVHFVGQVPYSEFQNIVQISRCHIYMTMPFVVSWSLLEAMSMQATVVASDVAPVREVVTHGETGLLVDFFDHDALADQVTDVLANPGTYANLGRNARKHVVKTYDFLNVCLPQHLEQINALAPDANPILLPGQE